jgi:hypothetical protein
VPENAGKQTPGVDQTIWDTPETGFIANIFPYRNRVSPKEAFEGPEPDDGKLSRPVLRGLAPSNGGQLLGEKRHRNCNGALEPLLAAI